jgi:hypothetical protein
MRKVNKSVKAKSVMGHAVTAGLAASGALAALVALSTMAAKADTTPTAPDALARVYACAAQADNALRLACYDSEVGALRTAQAKGEITAIDKQQAKKLEQESFGFNLPSLPTIAFPNLFGDGGEARTDTVSTIISRVTGQQKPTFVMENGQVWQSVDSETNRNARPGTAVSIRRAATGSFLMSVEAGGAALRVRRVN